MSGLSRSQSAAFRCTEKSTAGRRPRAIEAFSRVALCIEDDQRLASRLPPPHRVYTHAARNAKGPRTGPFRLQNRFEDDAAFSTSAAL